MPNLRMTYFFLCGIFFVLLVNSLLLIRESHIKFADIVKSSLKDQKNILLCCSEISEMTFRKCNDVLPG